MRSRITLGGLVGEGDGHDAPGFDAVFLDEIGDAVGEHAGLAGARAGQHEHRPRVVVTACCWEGLRVVEKGHIDQR